MKKILLLHAVVLALSSCYAPVDLSLSQAVAILRDSRVTYRATIGPIGDIGDDDDASEFTFLPSKISVAPGIDYQGGFLVMRSPTRTLVRYATSGGGAFGWWGADYVNPSPAYEPYLFEPVKFTTPAVSSPLGMLGMNPVDPTGNSVQLLNADLAVSNFDSGAGWQSLHDSFIMPAYDADAIGFSVYPSDFTVSSDTTYWLVRERGTGQLRELTGLLDSTNGLWNEMDTKAPLAFDIPELAGVTRCNYFYDPDPALAVIDRKSYVSWFDTAAGTWKCVTWKGTATIESALLTKVTHRIDALLTNGMLFSTEDGVGRLYDPDGGQLAEFPLGALRFAGERLESGVPVVVFSMARTVVEDYQTRLSIDVYTVETADLENL